VYQILKFNFELRIGKILTLLKICPSLENCGGCKDLLWLIMRPEVATMRTL
jgi:hypothetical protein